MAENTCGFQVQSSPWGREELDTTERLHFHALEKEMATHSSVLAWRIPGTGGGAWWAAVYGVAQGRTRLKRLSSSSSCTETKLVKTLEQMRLPGDGGKGSSGKRIARKERGERGGRLRGLQFSSVAQSCPTLCDPWTAARQASLSITNSRGLLELMSTESVMSSNHLILCRPLLSPSIFPTFCRRHIEYFQVYSIISSRTVR